MANKKPKIRTETVGVRLPPKLRYGLVLVARKNGLTLSEAMMRALETYLENDGIGAKPKEQGAMLSSLDRLWSESHAQRILRLVEHAPELASSHEHKIAAVLRECGITEGEEADRFMSEVVSDVFAFDSEELSLQLQSIAGTLRQHPQLADRFGSPSDFLQWLNKMFDKP
jgi:hypothetical protein